MTARSHDSFAFATLVTVSAFIQPQPLNVLTLFVAVIANNIGALIPDMDQAGNRLWDLLPAGDYIGKIFRRIFYKHRTLSHSLLGAFLIFKSLDWLLPKIANPVFINPDIILVSIMIGYLSHLLADSLTEEGLPLLFPLPLNIGFPPIASWRMTTGSWFETYFVQPGIFVYLIWFIATHQQELTHVFSLIGSS